MKLYKHIQICGVDKMAKLIDITGKAISGEWGTDDVIGDGIPVLRTTNFTNNGEVDYSDVVTRNIGKKKLTEKYLRHGDIIIEKSGGSDKQPVGRVIFFEGPENTYLFNNFTGLLRVVDQAQWLPRYVFYALFAEYRKGGTKPFENRTTGLHNLQIDSYVEHTIVPNREFDQQVFLCEALDSVSQIIKLRQRQLLALDTIIKARFVEIFGDPEYNSKGWPIKKLSELCNVGSSKRIYQEEQTMDGVPFWRISDLVIKMDTGNVESSLYISESKYEELKSQGLVPELGDILVTSRGTLGRCYIVAADDRFYFQDGMISWLNDYTDEITPLYIQYLFDMSGFRKQIDSLQAGSTVAYLSISMLKKLNIMLPDRKLQEQFATFVCQVAKSKVAVQAAMGKSQLLFDSMMQQYFG